MPFEVVSQLRQALAPGGVLLILGCYRDASWSDYALGTAAVPLNLVARSVSAAGSRLAARGRAPGPGTAAPVRPPAMTLLEIRREAGRLLPGCRIRRLLFWRYLLHYQAPAQRP
jgi:hypothetical protein